MSLPHLRWLFLGMGVFFLHFLDIKGKYTNWNRICDMILGRYLIEFNNRSFRLQTVFKPPDFFRHRIDNDNHCINQFIPKMLVALDSRVLRSLQGSNRI